MGLDTVVHDWKTLASRDKRRRIYTVLNGEFAANDIRIVRYTAPVEEALFSLRDLVYFSLRGTMRFNIEDIKPKGQDRAYYVGRHDRIFVPHQTPHQWPGRGGNELLVCSPHETFPCEQQHDAKKILAAGNPLPTRLLRSPFLPFPAQQVKVTEMRQDSTLGNHFHEYAEGFMVHRGYAEFTLKNIDNGSTCFYQRKPGDVVIIAPRMAHKVVAKAGTVLIGFDAEKYISPEHNDHKYVV